MQWQLFIFLKKKKDKKIYRIMISAELLQFIALFVYTYIFICIYSKLKYLMYYKQKKIASLSINSFYLYLLCF